MNILEESPSSAHLLATQSPLQTVLFRTLTSSPRSPKSFFSPKKRSLTAIKPVSRPRGYSTATTSSGHLSPTSPLEDYISTPEIATEFKVAYDDDEEIKPMDIPCIKQNDLEVSVEMVLNEMIVSSNSSITYPCYVSVKPKRELLVEKPGIDLILLLDIKDTDPRKVSATVERFLAYMDEKDRLSLFTTQRSQSKRFPLRTMDEPTKRQFINELSLLSKFSQKGTNTLTLHNVFKETLRTVESRRYKNHVSAIVIITDSAEKFDSTAFTNEEMSSKREENPLVFAFGLGQKHDPVTLEEICNAYEGRYHYTETLEELFEQMVKSFQEQRDVKAKNIKVSLIVGTNQGSSQNIKISRIYERKKIFEGPTQCFTAEKSYLSVKDGINMAVEIELSKCQPITDVEVNSCFLELGLTGESLAKTSQISFSFRKELSVKNVPSLFCNLPGQFDLKALENFHKIKGQKILNQALKMMSVGRVKQSVQALISLKKELYSFANLKIEAVQIMMENVELALSYIQDSSYKTRDKFLLIKDISKRLNCTVGKA